MPYIHEKIDFTAEVFIVYHNRVLLRKHDKYDMWLSVGGHIELGEDPNDAAVREIKEEVGLDITLYHSTQHSLVKKPGFVELTQPQFLNRHRINDNHEHVSLVYFGISTTDKLMLSETEKSDGCRWFTADELDEPQYGIHEAEFII